MKHHPSTTCHPKQTSHKRRGSLYISVMGVTLIVSMIGMSAMLSVRMFLKEAGNASAKQEAAQLASSGIEYGLHQINLDTGWRSTYTNDTEITPFVLGNGTVSFKLVDEDSNLADDTTDAVRLVGIGRVGNITYKESVLLMPTGNGFTCLEAAFHCNGSISLGFLVDLTTNQTISSNVSISANSWRAQIAGNAEAVSTISGDITGTTTEGITPRTMPGNNVFDYYKQVGTWIDVTSLPVDGNSDPIIENATISSTINPFGSSTNMEGIYVIDCAGQKLTIKNSRIEGTILILNPGASTQIRSSVYWTTTVKNYPALLVDGDIEMRTTTSVLSESNLSTNFNPTNFPYQGNTDTDTLDDYPSEIIGLVYVSGEMNFPLDAMVTKITGCVVSTTCLAKSDTEVNYYNTYLDYPPPGFATGPAMRVIPGTRKREQ